MSEELQENIKKEETPNEPHEEVSYTPDEVRAMESGWKPQDQWEGNPDDWVSAKEFNRRGELFARIAKYGNENKELRESVKKLFDHNRRLFDAGYKKAMDDLKQQKFSAIEEGDTRKLVEIDEQIDNLKEEHTKVLDEFDRSMVPSQNAQLNPNMQFIYEQWMDANPWYGKNADLTRIADNLANKMYAEARNAGKQLDYGKFLSEVVKQVKENNPQYFNSEKKTSSVDGGGTTRTPTRGGGKYSLSNIPETERDIARTIMASTGMKEEEYVKQYMQANRG